MNEIKELQKQLSDAMGHRMKNPSRGIYVKVLKATPPAWYADDEGEVFLVYKRPRLYYGGYGYKLINRLGGILVQDCEILEATE